MEKGTDTALYSVTHVDFDAACTVDDSGGVEAGATLGRVQSYIRCFPNPLLSVPVITNNLKIRSTPINY